MRRDLHELNRQSWNHATRAHNSHKGDQAAFFRAGGSTLFAEERALLGPLQDRRLVHLQCNAGQDSLSLAALGARVTAVDISDEAITFARTLSAGSGIAATFVRADVYDWLAEAPAASADVVFSSYGALCWLSDLPGWAAGAAKLLAPGGRLVVMEFHPLVDLLAPGDGPLRLADPSERVTVWPDGIGDYVADSGEGLTHGSPYQPGQDDFRNPVAAAEFHWSLAEVVDAVAQAGLVVRRLTEWPYSNGCRLLPSMVDRGDRRWVLPALPGLPLMYGLVAER